MRLFAVCKFDDIPTCPDNKVLHDNGGITWLLAFKVTLHRFLCESWDSDQNCAFHLNLILQYNSKEIFNCKTFLCSLLKKNNYNKNELFLALFLQWRNMSFKPNK